MSSLELIRALNPFFVLMLNSSYRIILFLSGKMCNRNTNGSEELCALRREACRTSGD